jgi:predicted AAA+ superfamily ATPase
MLTQRYLETDIEEISFSADKMAFVSGPRQCGKTTMAKRLLKKRGHGEYYNWDEVKFRRQWIKDPHLIVPAKQQSSQKPILVLDELHKAKLWKRSLKGIYDSKNGECDILVTGSARLNVYRKGSDSLLGRYYHFRLHPFSLGELLSNRVMLLPDTLIENVFAHSQKASLKAQKLMARLTHYGPFPEPFIAENQRILNLWQRNRIERIIREDLRDLSRLPELSQLEMLASLLPERVSSPLSLKALSEDLEVAYTTIKRWLEYLNELYYFYAVKPYARSLARAIKKEYKIYLWDWSEIDDQAARFENIIASHLLKYCHYLTDTGYGDFELRYLRNKEKLEIDFLILKDKKPWLPIEVKLNDDKPSENWRTFMKQLQLPVGIQIVAPSQIYHIHEFGSYQVLVISADAILSLLA